MKSPQKGKLKNILVVSGLPRSGTSMIMKMLSEGGLPLVTDRLRGPDADNPEGYFEFEPVKKLASGEIEWLAAAEGHAVKIISALLEYLPSSYQYKIVFMEREISEILRSQHKMLEARTQNSTVTDAEMKDEFLEHLSAVKFWLARQPNIEVLYINYAKMIVDPDEYCKRMADFTEVPLDLAKMRSVPNARLYRNRSTSA